STMSKFSANASASVWPSRWGNSWNTPNSMTGSFVRSSVRATAGYPGGRAGIDGSASVRPAHTPERVGGVLHTYPPGHNGHNSPVVPGRDAGPLPHEAAEGETAWACDVSWNARRA